MGAITQAQAIALIEALNRQKQWSVDSMPTEEDARLVFFKAWERLKAFGWREIMYHPPEGVLFEVIEPGSTGTFPCMYQKKPERGSFWIQEAGGCPLHPCLFRLITERPALPQDSTHE